MEYEYNTTKHLFSQEAFDKNAVPFEAFSPFQTDKKAQYLPIAYKAAHVIMAGDANGFNAGSFFVRRTDLMDVIFDIWGRGIGKSLGTHNYQEQAAFQHLMVVLPSLQQRVVYFNKKKINAYPMEYKENDNNLAVHFAGCAHAVCKAEYQKFREKRNQKRDKAFQRRRKN